MTLPIIIALSFFAGYSLAFFIHHRSRNAQQLAERLKQKEQELDTYQSQVASHFEQTSALFETLGQQHDKIVSHLMQAAQQLRYPMLKIANPEESAENILNKMQPRDYSFEKTEI